MWIICKTKNEFQNASKINKIKALLHMLWYREEKVFLFDFLRWLSLWDESFQTINAKGFWFSTTCNLRRKLNNLLLINDIISSQKSFFNTISKNKNKKIWRSRQFNVCFELFALVYFHSSYCLKYIFDKNNMLLWIQLINFIEHWNDVKSLFHYLCWKDTRMTRTSQRQLKYCFVRSIRTLTFMLRFL